MHPRDSLPLEYSYVVRREKFINAFLSWNIRVRFSDRILYQNFVDTKLSEKRVRKDFFRYQNLSILES